MRICSSRTLASSAAARMLEMALEDERDLRGALSSSDRTSHRCRPYRTASSGIKVAAPKRSPPDRQPGIAGATILAMNRWRDWWDQGQRDLAHAEHALDDADHEWAAFAAQQAAEKALKALIQSLGGEPWGHSITALVESLPAGSQSPVDVGEAANRLDKHYIPSRYPNGFASGYPGKLYTRGEAEGAIADARQIVEFCRRKLPG